MLLAAAACYLAVVTARHGPTPGWDTGPLTAVTTELSTGDLRAAASNSSLPNPPGYALLASPFVVALRPVIGSPVWCTTGNPSAPRHAGPKAVRSPAPAGGTGDCGQPAALGRGTAGSPPPPWYHSQGMLGVLGWLVLAVGALALLRAAGADSLGRTAGLLVFLAFLPAASSAIVQLYHPQDIVSLGLALAGLAQVLRCRWVLAGLLFGVAFLTKQFAILVLLPALAAAPDRKSRLAIVTPAAAVFAAGLLPFLVSAPRATFDNFSGISGGGALAGATVLTELGVTGSVGSAVARDAPVVFAVVVCLWARRRIGLDLARPVCLVALALACVGSRLVFESVLFPYYLLGTSVIFFLLDLVARRSPHRSLAWSAAAAFFVALRPANRALDAVVTLVLAVLGVLSGLAELRVVRRQPISQPPSLVPTLADDPS
jgi:hypothetical protein